MSGNFIRVHESNRQVHFYDDAAALKVSIPVDEFAARYANYLTSPQGDLLFVDFESGTAVVLTYEEIDEGQIVNALLDVRLERVGPTTVR
jgi:hypothetical protein